MENKVKLVALDLNDLDHLNLMYSVRTHPDVDQYLCQLPPADFSKHVQYLKKAMQSGTKRFFVIDSQDHLCGYCHVTSREDTLELGWALHPDWWGKGIGKCSVSLLIQLLQEFGLAEGKVLTLIVKKDNIKAISLYKKSGFVILGETEHQEYRMQYTHFFPEALSSRDTERG